MKLNHRSMTLLRQQFWGSLRHLELCAHSAAIHCVSQQLMKAMTCASVFTIL